MGASTLLCCIVTVVVVVVVVFAVQGSRRLSERWRESQRDIGNMERCVCTVMWTHTQ